MKGSLPFLTAALRAGYAARCSPSSKEARWPKTDRATHSVCEPHIYRSNPSVLSYGGRPAGRFELPLGMVGGASVGRSALSLHNASDSVTNWHPDETTRDLFFSFLNSGEADMLSGQLSETTPLTLSRPERSGCGNGLPNPVTGAHGLAVMASSFNRADVGSCESGNRPHRG